jgi:hypothetical protein
MWTNPYFYCFRVLIDNICLNRDKVPTIPIDEKVDFYFDERTEKKIIWSAWDETVEKAEEWQRKFFGSAPRFEDDSEFLPLQAADYWAWWVRKWYEEENSDLPEKMRNFNFGSWQGKKRPLVAINNRLEQIVERLNRYRKYC